MINRRSEFSLRHRVFVVPGIAAFLVSASLFVGCGHKKEAKDDGHGEQAPPGASFKAGKGVLLTDEMRQLLGVVVADVSEKKLPNELHFTVQVFGEKHHPAVNPLDHSGCDVHGSGLVSSEAVAAVQAGQPVQLRKGTNGALAGVVLSVQKALMPGESEIVVGMSNAAALLQPGEFIAASLSQPRHDAVTAVPHTALLRAFEGTFVYAVNGDGYVRTGVKVGAASDGFVEITDGLLAGDQVVTKGVAALWLIELRATKAGDACTH